MIGYEAHGDKGSMKLVGATNADECFTGNIGTGTINISAMWRDINAGKAKASIVSALIDDNIMVAMENKDIDPGALARMTPERAELPIIGIRRADGTTSIVDGNHRLSFKFKRGDGIVLAWLFDERALETYKVQIFLADPPAPGQTPDWKLQTADQLLAHTIGTYPVLDGNGILIGMRDERKKA